MGTSQQGAGLQPDELDAITVSQASLLPVETAPRPSTDIISNRPRR